MEKKKLYLKIIFGIFLFLFLSYSFHHFIQQNEELNTEKIMEHLKDVSKQTANLYYNKFEEAKEQIEGVSHLIGEHYLNSDDIGKILNNLENDNNLFNRIWYLNEDKKSYNYMTGEVIQTNGNYVKDIFDGKTGISDVFVSAYNDKEIIAVYSPVYRNKKIVGGVVGIIEINDEDNDFIYDDLFDNTAYVFAITQKGQIITKLRNHNTLYLGSNYLDFLQNDVIFENNSYNEIYNNILNNEQGYIEYYYKNNGRVGFYTPVSINNWYVFTIISDDIIVQQMNQVNEMTFALLLSLVIVLLFIFFTVIHYFIKSNKQIESMNDQLQDNNKKIETILKLTSDRIFEYHADQDSFILDAWDDYPKVIFNHFLSNLYNYEFVSREHEDLLKEKFNQLMNGEKEVSFDAKLPYISKDDETWFHVSIINVFDNHKFIGSFQNSTKQMNEYNNLLQDQMFKNSVYAHSLYMFAVHLKSQKVVISQQKGIYHNYVNYDYESQFMKNFLEKTYFKDRKIVEEFFNFDRIQNLYHQSQLNDKIEFRYMNEDTKEYEWIRYRIQFERQSSNNDIIMIAYSNDIDDEKKVQLENEYRAQRDGLTGLLNRDTFNQKVNENLSQKHSSYQYSAYMILDLDNFKYINDHLGHAVGDEVLKEFSNILENIFSNKSYVGRFGGDEFLVYIYDQISYAAIEEKANEVLNTVNDFFMKDYSQLSCSIGICFVKDEKHYKELFIKSDESLYICKKSGKNSFKVYNNER